MSARRRSGEGWDEGRADSVDVVAGRPGLHHPGSLDGVAVQEGGDALGGRVAPTAPQGLLPRFEAVADVSGDDREPGLVEVLLDDVEDCPGETPRRPGVVAFLLGELGEQVEGPHEGDARADAVFVSGGRAEPVAEGLGEPPLHPGCRDHDEVALEGVLGRLGQQPREPLREHVGPLRPMDRQRHTTNLAVGADTSRDPVHSTLRLQPIGQREGSRPRSACGVDKARTGPARGS